MTDAGGADARGSRHDRIHGERSIRWLEAAGTLIPLAYIGWSTWLLALGIGLLITA